MMAWSNQIAALWWNWMWPMFWQVGLLILVVAALDLLLRRWAWPQVRYALWLLVLVRLVLPPGLSLPPSVTSELQPMVADKWALSIPAAELGVITAPAFPAAASVLPLAAADDGAWRPMADVAPGGLAAPLTDTAKPSATATTGPTWQVGAFLVWLVGTCALGGWLGLGLRGLRGENQAAHGAQVPGWFHERLAETAGLLGLRRVPQVLLSSKVRSPAVFGLTRPVLLMPADKMEDLLPQEAGHILLHELAHIKRGDLWVHTFSMILQIAYWFHPLLWLVRRQLQHLRELCCDVTVARILREETGEYRTTLLETARRLMAEKADPGLGLLGLFEDSNRLLARLKWLEKKPWKHPLLRLATVLAVTTLMAACILPMASAQKEIKFLNRRGEDIENKISVLRVKQIEGDRAPVQVVNYATTINEGAVGLLRCKMPETDVYSHQRPGIDPTVIAMEIERTDYYT